MILVDHEDEYLLLLDWKISPNGYVTRYFGNERLYLHRLIMNPPKGMVVDHINGNKLDCRKSNMRVCTYSQNAMNVRKEGFKGVHHSKDPRYKKPWRARIKINNKLIDIGRYATPEEAALAYDERAKVLFGEYAHLNFP